MDGSASSWSARYGQLIEALPDAVRRARLTLCGLSSVLDAVLPLRDAGALLADDAPQAARTLAGALRARVQDGIGGEIRLHWPDGADWLDRTLPFRLDIGGGGPHAARALVTVGAPALLALECRGPAMRAVLDPRIQVAVDGRPTPCRDLPSGGVDARRVYIFESTAGEPFAGLVPRRSTRIIVRLHDSRLEDDPEFRATSLVLAAQAGAGILAGFSIIGSGDLDAALAEAHDLAGGWRRAGLALAHLELAGYEQAAYRDRVLRRLGGVANSLGMSVSELRELAGDDAEADLGAALLALVRRYGFERVWVHADDWAASLTRGDPRRETEALMTGCLLAASRAAHSQPVAPRALPPDARLALPGWLEANLDATRADGWHLAAAPAPWIEHPATTLGLGDTFMAGCLLVLGAHDAP